MSIDLLLRSEDQTMTLRKIYNNNSGRVLTIFLVIIAILLVTLTAGAIFYWQKEISFREEVEQKLSRSEESIGTLQKEFSDLNKQKLLLEAKNKEADERINSLLDELDLQEGLREELKGEVSAVNLELEKAKTAKDQLREQLSKSLKDAEAKLADLTVKLKGEIDLKQKLKDEIVKLENEIQELRQAASVVTSPGAMRKSDDESNLKLQNRISIIEKTGIESIDVVVSNPNQISEGRILSVDKDTEFVIVNIGAKDGVEQGAMLSVYRGKEYLGDIKITRVQPEMSAADLIPPFTSQVARKNDQVVLK